MFRLHLGYKVQFESVNNWFRYQLHNCFYRSC